MTEPSNISINDNGKKQLDILICDDSPLDIAVVERIVAQCELPWNLKSVSSSSECLAYLQTLTSSSSPASLHSDGSASLPDLVFLDINMPGLTGLQLIEHIRAIELMHSIPIIMLTSSKSKEEVARAYAAGASSYLVKPIQFKEFRTLLQTTNQYWQHASELPDV